MVCKPACMPPTVRVEYPGAIYPRHGSGQPLGTPTVRRVRARGLQERGSVVGRVPSRGVQRCEISGIGAGRPSALGGGHGVVSPHESIHSATGGAWDPVGFSGAAGTLFLEWADRPTISTERFVSRLDRRR